MFGYHYFVAQFVQQQNGFDADVTFIEIGKLIGKQIDFPNFVIFQ